MKKLIQNQAIRYIFFGGCTTMVNLFATYLFRNVLGMDIIVSNTTAIFLSILFAYVVNKLFVFEHKTTSIIALLKEAGSFIGMRLGTLLVEVLGVVLLSSIWGMNDMIAKMILQVVILVLNYLISKFIVFKDSSEVADAKIRLQKKISQRYFAAGFLLTILVTGIGFFFVSIWPSGDKILLIIDSLHQYLPFYTDFHEKLVNSDSLLFSFSGGLGYNFWSTYAYYMASPLNFLMSFIPTKHVCDFMDLMILIKIGLCGGCFSWYLHQRDSKKKYLPVVFGMMYALSNFVIGYYFNLMWLDSIAVLPLIMLGIERIVKGRSGRLFCLSLFYGLWCNYYIGFMLCIFSCLYFLVRWISEEQIVLKQVGKSCLNFGWYALLSGGMAALVLLPAFMGLATSESMQSNSFPTTVKFYTTLTDMLENHLAYLEPINIANTQVGLNAYCGLFTVLLAVLYLFDRKLSLRERLAHYGLCGFMLLSFSCNILNYIWHGFHIQNGLPNRFAFIYIAVLLVMAYDAVGHIRSFRLSELLFSIALPLVFIYYRMQKPDQEIDLFVFYISMGILFVYFGMLLLGKYMTNIRYTIYYGIISILLLVEVSSNAVYGIHCNGSVTRSIYLADQSSYQTMMAEQEETGFFRSEVDRQRMRNVTMFAGGNALVMFNSTMHGDFIDFCDHLGIEARTNKNGYLGVTKLMNDVFGIRYLASPSKKADTMYQFKRLTEDGELALYKNDTALSLGFMVNSDILDWDTNQTEPLDVHNEFVELATGHESIFVLDRTIDMEDGETYKIKIPENKQVYLCIDTRVEKIDLTTPEFKKDYKDYTDHLYIINGTPGEDMAEFTVTLKDGQTSVPAQVYTCSNDAYQEVLNRLSESQLTDLEVSGNLVMGKVNAGEDGILLISTPYDAGWKVYVDGEKTEFEKVGDALMGVPVQAGEHEISMKFTPPGLWMGSFISIICLLLFFLSGIWERKHPDWFNQETEEEENVGMKLEFSDKSNQIEAGIFAILNQKKEELAAKGMTIYNLSIGTPDFKPAHHIIDAVSEAAKYPENYKYAVIELPALIEAAQGFFKRRFDLDLKENEIMTMYGSQEGMAHIAWALCNPGDLVLVPNPGYPIFSIGPQLCDAEVWEYPLYAENGFLPDLDAIPEEIAEKAKLMVVCYPGNPCCKKAPDEFYRSLISFAKKYNIIILHDNAYADLVFGTQGGSFLNFEGAKEVGIEFYSLSKTFNYTGARMSFAIGNEEIIQKFKALRTQFDYGTFLPVQYGAIAALNGPFEGVYRQCEEYEERSKTLCGGLREIGWDVPDSEGTMFVWAPLPKGYTDSEKFTMELMEKSGVICVPGTSFGSLGEGYVRMALVLPPEKLREAVESIRKSGIIKK